jgi:hypothetical protein
VSQDQFNLLTGLIIIALAMHSVWAHTRIKFLHTGLYLLIFKAKAMQEAASKTGDEEENG